MYSSEYTSGFSGPVASHLVAPLSPRHEGNVGQAPRTGSRRATEHDFVTGITPQALSVERGLTPHLREAMMKKMLFAVSGMTLLMAGIAFAEAETPVIDQRQANQEQRIDRGVTSGQLNEKEADRLNKQQEQVNKMENRAKSDGVMTEKERARINEAQARASRHVAREKHDRQGKRHR
jgi:hypothetical protein